MKVKLENGLEVEVSRNDAKNIARHILNIEADEAENPFVFCERYLKKALQHINEADKDHSNPESEAELKRVWYKNIRGTSEKEIELLYEGTEAIVYMAMLKLLKRLMPLIDK